MEDKKKIGLIVTGVSLFLCGCPGLCLLIFGVLMAVDSDLVDTPGNYQLLGAGLICLALLFIVIPIGAGIYTYLESRKESEAAVEDIGEIPPAI